MYPCEGLVTVIRCGLNMWDILRVFLNASRQRELVPTCYVEDKYEISRVPGVSMTVYLPGRDLVFHRKGKQYVAEMSDWTQLGRGTALVPWLIARMGTRSATWLKSLYRTQAIRPRPRLSG